MAVTEPEADYIPHGRFHWEMLKVGFLKGVSQG